MISQISQGLRVMFGILVLALCWSCCGFKADYCAEPLESDLAKTVEYDMDEQGSLVFLLYPIFLSLALDEEWLNAVNEDRKKNQLDRIDQEVFEIMMDRLEKEWFDLVRLYHVFLGT